MVFSHRGREELYGPPAIEHRSHREQFKVCDVFHLVRFDTFDCSGQHACSRRKLTYVYVQLGSLCLKDFDD